MWVKSPEGTVTGLPAAVVFEMLVGAINKKHLEQASELVDAFRVETLTPDDTVRAIHLLSTHVLSTGLGLGDYLIAAQSLNRNAILYTFNLKNFLAIPGLRAEAPYSR